MLELGLVGGMLAGVVGLAALLALVPWYFLFGGGLAAVGLGMLIGLPAGFFYHLAIYRALGPRGKLRSLWWLNPTGFHDALTDAERAAMRWPFRIGAAAFVFAILGCICVGVGALRS